MITTTTVTTCDRCGTADATELRFTVAGRALAIDLCGSHRQEWNAVVGPFIADARPEPKRHLVTQHATARHNGATYDIAGLRAWASANDVALPARGRIPYAVRAEYEAWSQRTAARRSA